MDQNQTRVQIPRLALVDMVRGAAIIGVIFYHLVWDLCLLEFHGVDVNFDPGWLAFSRTLLAIFLFLTGFSLVLSHGNGMRWKAFWRRFSILCAASLAVTIGTYFLFPDAFVFFGVLHAIALFSLLAVPFLRAPVWLTLILGVAALAVGWMFRSPVFNDWYLSWIGFWTVPPLTQDLVPVFPGIGFTLLGLVAAKIGLERGYLQKLSGVRADKQPMRGLVFAGRWSLVIYLIHQPVLLAGLYPLASWLQPGAALRAAEFVSSCERSCEIGAGEPGFCTRYCACSLDQVEAGDLWPIINLPTPTLEQSREVSTITRLCSAMAVEE